MSFKEYVKSLIEEITPSYIENLKAKYNSLENVDSSSEDWLSQMRAFDKLSTADLQAISNEKIKFVSAAALGKIGKRNAKKVMKLEAKEMKPEDNPCWDDYEMVGFKKKNGKKVPNCVPKKDMKEDRVLINEIIALLKRGDLSSYFK